MRLLIAIVNYRTPLLAIDCLRSLAPEVAALGDAHVSIVDGGSGDDSCAQIAAAIEAHGWRGWLTFTPLDHNGGFAHANNVAIHPYLQSADPPRYILLLNPDTIVRPGAIAALIDFLDAHPRAGIAGSRLEDRDGTPQRSAFRFHSIASEFEGGIRLGLISRLLHRHIVAPPVPPDECRTDWLAGASMMIRREVFQQIGPLDDRYFMYFEEVDFCLRAARAGWECWYVPRSRIVHLVGQASGVTDPRQRKRRPLYWFDSRRRYFLKNHGPVYSILADAAWATGFALWRLRRRIQRRADADPPKLLGDFVRNSVLFRGFAT